MPRDRCVSLLLLVTLVLALGACGSAGTDLSPEDAEPAPEPKSRSSSDARLADLVFSHGPLTPAFDPAVRLYSIGPAFLASDLSLKASPADPDATLRVNGVETRHGDTVEIPLLPGRTLLTIAVEAEDGKTVEETNVSVARVGPSAQLAYLKSTHPREHGAFGKAVALSGETVVIGTQSEEHAPYGSRGAAHVYRFTGGKLLHKGRLLVPEPAPAEGSGGAPLAGFAVAIDGSAIVVGAPGVDRAYVYRLTTEGWMFEAELEAADNDPLWREEFGASVAIDGARIVVGAPREPSLSADNPQDTSAPDAGAAYVFERVESVWRQTAMLKAINAGAGDEFGLDVDIDGSSIVVGAHYEDNSTTLVAIDDDIGVNAGAAYVYVRLDGTWQHHVYLKHPDPDPGDIFGRGVAISGNRIAVTVIGDDSLDGDPSDYLGPHSGACAIFERTGVVWSFRLLVKADPGARAFGFGSSVDLDGDTLVVGHTYDRCPEVGVHADPARQGRYQTGAAYVYGRTGTTWTRLGFLKAAHPGPDDLFGGAVAVDDDVVAVGASSEDSAAEASGGDASDDSRTGSGAAYLFR